MGNAASNDAKTFSYCATVTNDGLKAGFESCERLTNYSTTSSVMERDSITWNLTESTLDAGQCTLEAAPQSLSCFLQVGIAPYLLPGGNATAQDLDFFDECAEQVGTPFPAKFTDFMIACLVVIGIFFIVPNVWLFAIVLGRPKQVKPGAASQPEKEKSVSKKAAKKAASQAKRIGGAVASAVPKFGGIATPGRAKTFKQAECARIYLSFTNIHYSVTLNSSAKAKARTGLPKDGPKPTYWDVKHVLQGVSGVFAPGTLSAIMGPSGCGKSTLLDVLADRKETGNTAGTVLLNGEPRGRMFKRISAYVMQFDALFETLTVREMLAYTAELRLPGNDMKYKAAAVERVIEALDLKNVADTRIGGGTQRRGISGGQARRVTVGVELVTSPSVLFLDEPTTGLDAYSSLLLVRALRRLADTGRTVLCTIHQPRPDIFSLFDTLLLMSGGQVAYFGSTTSIDTYLGRMNIQLPVGTNPADFVVDLTYAKEDAFAEEKDGEAEAEAAEGAAAGGEPRGEPSSSVSPQLVSSGDAGVKPAENESTVDRLVSSWLHSTQAKDLAATCAQITNKTLPGLPPPLHDQEGDTEVDHPAVKGMKVGGSGGVKARSLMTQVSILTRRAYLKGCRDSDFWYRTLFIPAIQFIFYGLLFLGTRVYGWSPPDGQWTENDTVYLNTLRLITAKRAFLFQVMSAIVMTETSILAEAYIEQRAFRREHAAGAYSAAAYHIQWAVRLMSQSVWKGVLFGAMVFWWPYQFNPTAETFFYFLADFALLSNVGSSFSLLMISFIPDPAGAGAAHNAVLAVLLQFSGFFLPSCLMPPVVNIPYYISFGRFAFEGLIENEFGQPTGSQWNWYTRQSLAPNFSKWTNLLALCVYPLGFHVIASLFTFLHTRPKSFWTKFDSPAKRLATEQRAQLLEPTAEAHYTGLGLKTPSLKTPSMLRTPGRFGRKKEGGEPGEGSSSYPQANLDASLETASVNVDVK